MILITKNRTSTDIKQKNRMIFCEQVEAVRKSAS